MAEVAKSGQKSDSAVARATAEAVEIGGAWPEYVEKAVRWAVDFKQTLGSAADSGILAAGSGVSQIGSAYSQALSRARNIWEVGKSHYAAAEEEAIWKIKDGMLVAAERPVLTCGIATGMGLVLFKRPRRVLIRNTRRIFLSEESLISNFQAKVNELEQSVNLAKNESIKLLNRAKQAEEEIKRARNKLIQEGNLIQKELSAVSRIERQITGLKDHINELPKREVSRFQSKVSAMASQVKKEKKALNSAQSKIINHGIPM